MRFNLSKDIQLTKDSKSGSEIESFLSSFIGLPLTRKFRAGDMQCFDFGVYNTTNKDNKPITIGEFGIHIQASWRITLKDRLYTGYDDQFEPNESGIDKYDRAEQSKIVHSNILNTKLHEMFEADDIILKDIMLDLAGGIELFFTHDYVLSVFPTQSFGHEEAEHWRIMDRRGHGDHLDSSTNGLQLS